MKIVAIVQARQTSSRFPNKVLQKINGRSIVQIIFKRLSLSKKINDIIFAIPDNKENLELKKEILKFKARIYLGFEDNVLGRYYYAAKKSKADIIIRITADCPMVDYKLLDKMIHNFLSDNLDYLANNIQPTFPDGLDIEIFKYSALKKAFLFAKKKDEKEHVTKFFYNNPKIFKIKNYFNKKNYSNLRVTLDEHRDFLVINKIFNFFKPRINFCLDEIINLYKKNPLIFSKNSSLKRNEGSLINNNQKLWKRAKNVIADGNMLLSKNPKMFIEDLWPTYYSKAKDYSIWDLTGKKFYDFSYMGVGTNILGYANKDVDNAVIKNIKKSNLSTLNCPEEVYLAEKLIEINPWAGQVKFARTGGEANSIAIRLARAATGKDKIITCGYHGWHDWYLSVNLKDKDLLNKHLFPNLRLGGVPKILNNMTFSFDYNDFNQLKKIVDSSSNIAALIMEVKRNFEPKNNFLEKIRNLTRKKGIILIFDECTTGFRECYGGIYKKYNVIPDMVMFGKALGNGYAITAVVGREDIMKSSKKTFISSTFWTERSGPTAALKTLEIMKNIRSWEIICKKGKTLKQKIKELADRLSLKIYFNSIESIVVFNFISKNNNFYIKYIIQEMLKKNILASNAIYLSTKHDDRIFNLYLKNLKEIFFQISKFENGLDISKFVAVNEENISLSRVN